MLHMIIGARVSYWPMLSRTSVDCACLAGDAIAFLSRTALAARRSLIRIWIGKSALVLSVLISTDWTTVVRMAEGSYPIPDLSLGSHRL